MSDKPLTGSCLCGKVTYQVNLPATPEVNFCFCSRCRKSSAGLVDAYVMIPRTALTITEGKQNLTENSIKGDSGYDVKRAFCKDCGSRICGWCTTPKDEAMFDGAGSLTMGIGTLDVPMEEIDTWKIGEKFYEQQKALIRTRE